MSLLRTASPVLALILCAGGSALVAADAKPDANGFVTIFNGTDLTGWEGMEGYWSVKDGVISGHETKDKSKQTFLIFTPAKVSDFELRLKFKFAAVDGKVDGNNVSFTVKREMGGNTVVTKYEGTVSGDEMKLKIIREGGPGPVEVTAKRSTT